MRRPFQVLVLPYRYRDKKIQYAIFFRRDFSFWQFVSGGGEDDESPHEAASRELYEETSIKTRNIFRLKSMCYLSSEVIFEYHDLDWPDDLYVIPEYAFSFECRDEIKLSREHTRYLWVDFNQANKLLKWDSNKTALFELNARLTNKKMGRNTRRRK